MQVGILCNKKRKATISIMYSKLKTTNFYYITDESKSQKGR